MIYPQNSLILKLIITIFISSLLVQDAKCQNIKKVYVQAAKGCGQNCAGNEAQPYDNLYAAFSADIASFDRLEIVLLKGTDSDQSKRLYAFIKEYDSSSVQTERYDIGAIIIRKPTEVYPLRCSDSNLPAQFQNNCYAANEKAIVYAKGLPTITVLETEFFINDVIMNLYDDVLFMNPTDNAARKKCLGLRQQCCRTPTTAKDDLSLNIYCYRPLQYTPQITEQPAWIYLAQNTTKTLQFVNFELHGAQHTGSMIQPYVGNMAITLTNFKILDGYFGSGLIAADLSEAKANENNEITTNDLEFRFIKRYYTPSVGTTGGGTSFFQLNVKGPLEANFGNVTFTKYSDLNSGFLSSIFSSTITFGNVIYNEITNVANTTFPMFNVQGGSVTLKEFKFPAAKFSGGIFELDVNPMVNPKPNTVLVVDKLTLKNIIFWKDLTNHWAYNQLTPIFQAKAKQSLTIKELSLENVVIGPAILLGNLAANGEMIINSFTITNCHFMQDWRPTEIFVIGGSANIGPMTVTGGKFRIEKFFIVKSNGELSLGATTLKQVLPVLEQSINTKVFFSTFFQQESTSTMNIASLTLNSCTFYLDQTWKQFVFMIVGANSNFQLGAFTITGSTFVRYPLINTRSNMAITSISISSSVFVDNWNILQMNAAKLTLGSLSLSNNFYNGSNFQRDELFKFTGECIIAMTGALTIQSERFEIYDAHYVLFKVDNIASQTNLKDITINSLNIQLIHEANNDPSYYPRDGSLVIFQVKGKFNFQNFVFSNNQLIVATKLLARSKFQVLEGQRATMQGTSFSATSFTLRGKSAIFTGTQSTLAINSLTISGGSYETASPIFSMESDSTLTLTTVDIQQTSFKGMVLFRVINGKFYIQGGSIKKITFDDSKTFVMLFEDCASTISNLEIKENKFLGTLSPYQFDRSSIVTFTKVNFTSNIYDYQAIAFSSDRLARVTFDQNIFEGDILKNVSFYFKVATATIRMTNCKFLNVKKQSLSANPTTKQVEESKEITGKFSIGAYADSTLNIENCNFTDIALNFITWNSNFNIKSTTITKVDPINKWVRLIKGSASTMLIQDSVFQDVNTSKSSQGTIPQNIIDVDNSQLVIKNVKLRNFTSDSGFYLRLATSTAILTNFTMEQLFITTNEPVFISFLSNVVFSNSHIHEVYNFWDSQQDTTVITKGIHVEIDKEQTDFIALQFFRVNNIILQDSIFSFNSSNQYSIKNIPTSMVYFRQIQSSIALINSTFKGGKGQYGVVFVDAGFPSVSILKSKFLNNLGFLSGALGILSLETRFVSIVDSNFTGNEVKRFNVFTGGFGGALTMTTSNVSEVKLTITSCHFEQNKAELFGGAIYTYGIPPVYKGNSVFKNNFVRGNVSNHFGTQNAKIQLIMYDLKEKSINTPVYDLTRPVIKIPGLASGITYNQEYVIAIMDHYGQVAQDDSRSFILFLAGAGLTVNPKSLNAINGIFDLQGMVVTISKASTDVSLGIQTNGIPTFPNVKISSSTRLLEGVDVSKNEIHLRENLKQQQYYQQQNFNDNDDDQFELKQIGETKLLSNSNQTLTEESYNSTFDLTWPQIQQEQQSSNRELSTQAAIEIHLRKCGSGEVKDSNTGTCTACLPGEFLILEDTHELNKCKSCNSFSMICSGGDEVGVEAGYWRMNKTADIFLKCLYSHACAKSKITKYRYGGDKVEPSGTCNSPYEGNLCNNCKDGYGKSNDGTECLSCQKSTRIYLQIVAALCGLSFIVAMSAKVLLYSENYFGPGDPEKKSLSIKRVALTRILINFLQKIGIVASIEIGWEGVVEKIGRFDESATIAHSDIFGLDCLYSQYKIDSPIRKVFMKDLLSNGILPCFTIVMAIALAIYYKFYKKQALLGDSRYKHTLWVCFLVMYFNHGVSLVRQNLYMFSCRNLYRTDKSEYYMTLDYDTKCWQGLHYSWTMGLSLPTLLVLGIGLPAYFGWKIKKKKRLLINTVFKKRYFFLYAGLKIEKINWEISKYFSKIFLLLVIYLGQYKSPVLQIYLIIYIMIASLLIHIITKPYTHKICNDLETGSHLAVLMMNVVGLYFGTIRYTQGLTELITVLAAGLLIAYLVWWLCEFFEPLREIMRVVLLRKLEKKMTSKSKLVRGLSKGLSFMIKKKQTQEILEPEEDGDLIKPQFKAPALLFGQKINDDDNDNDVQDQSEGVVEDNESVGAQKAFVAQRLNVNQGLVSSASSAEARLMEENSPRLSADNSGEFKVSKFKADKISLEESKGEGLENSPKFSIPFGSSNLSLFEGNEHSQAQLKLGIRDTVHPSTPNTMQQYAQNHQQVLEFNDSGFDAGEGEGGGGGNHHDSGLLPIKHEVETGHKLFEQEECEVDLPDDDDGSNRGVSVVNHQGGAMIQKKTSLFKPNLTINDSQASSFVGKPSKVETEPEKNMFTTPDDEENDEPDSLSEEEPSHKLPQANNNNNDNNDDQNQQSNHFDSNANTYNEDDENISSRTVSTNTQILKPKEN